MARPRLIPANLGGSSLVALGIFVSRIFGLLRESAISHYFGAHTAAADSFRAAIRIPNLLNNLFGEGVLSAAFITVYSKLRAQGRDDEAEHLAETIFGILCLVCAVLVLVGVALTPYMIPLIVPGYHDAERRNLTIRIVQILFPGTGVVVLSAWCLAVLNSHRRFLLAYTAPVALNLGMIMTLVLLGSGTAEDRLVLYLAWGYLFGSVLQFLVQLPRVLDLLPDFWPSLDFVAAPVRQVIDNFGPIFVSRGVIQISVYVDQMIASFLPKGSVAILGYGQVIALLPVSLFSMSISAAELPALSSAVGTPKEIADMLQTRLTAGLRRIAFFVIPSAVAFLILGDILAAALFQTGRFNRTDSVHVWAALAGSAVGLLASSLGRLYSSGFYALLDTRTPLRYAVIRIALTISLGYICALKLPAMLGIDPQWGVTGLTASAGVAGWVEFILLRHGLNQRIGKTGVPLAMAAQLWGVALISAACAYGCKLLLGTGHPRLLALLALPLFGAIYFLGTAKLGIPEAAQVTRLLTRRFGR